MVTGKKKKEDGVSSDWKASQDLPPGWMLRLTSGGKAGGAETKKRTYTYIRDPKGRTFFGRKQALQFMLERGYNTDEVEKMRGGLLHEGWSDHHLLPKGWKMRGQGPTVNFLTEQAEVIKTENNAIKFIKSNFPPDIVEKFKTFVENNTKKRRILNFEFHADDSLPEGWKSRGAIKLGKPGTGFYLLSPTNEQFSARRVALRFFQHRFVFF